MELTEKVVEALLKMTALYVSLCSSVCCLEASLDISDLKCENSATASLGLFNTSVVTKKKKKKLYPFWTSEQVFMLSLLLDWFTYWAIYLIVYFLLQGVQNWGGITERLWISKPKCYLAMIHIHWMHWLMLHINCFHVFGLFLYSTEYHFPENLSSLLAVLIISVYLLK